MSNHGRTPPVTPPEAPFYIWVPRSLPQQAVVAIRGASIIEFSHAHDRLFQTLPAAIQIEDWCDTERLEMLELDVTRMGEQLVLLGQLARLYDMLGKPRLEPVPA